MPNKPEFIRLRLAIARLNQHRLQSEAPLMFRLAASPSAAYGSTPKRQGHSRSALPTASMVLIVIFLDFKMPSGQVNHNRTDFHIEPILEGSVIAAPGPGMYIAAPRG